MLGPRQPQNRSKYGTRAHGSPNSILQPAAVSSALSGQRLGISAGISAIKKANKMFGPIEPCNAWGIRNETQSL